MCPSCDDTGAYLQRVARRRSPFLSGFIFAYVTKECTLGCEAVEVRRRVVSELQERRQQVLREDLHLPR